MSYDRRTSLIAGLVFLATFVFSIPQLGTFDAALNNHRFILGAGSDTAVVVGTFFELLNVVVNIATAIIFFPILKRQSERISFGYVADRIFEGVMIAIGLISVMALLALRWQYEGVTVADPSALLVTGRSLVAIHDATFLLGPAFCAGFGNGILLGYLMYKTRLVPRGLAMIGLIGGALALHHGNCGVVRRVGAELRHRVPLHVAGDRVGVLAEHLPHLLGVPALACPREHPTRRTNPCDRLAVMTGDRRVWAPSTARRCVEVAPKVLN